MSTVLTELRKQLAFALLGLDTDSDSVFMNEALKEYCEQADIVFTRCRPYRKNDQAFVEQRNGAVVRRMVGYRPFDGLETAALLAQLYRSARLFVNFQPSFKLIRKERDGARVQTTYSAPATPHRRLVVEARTPDAVRARVNEVYTRLDPVALRRDIRAVQEKLACLTESAPASHPTARPPIEQFLSSLRIAWKEGGDADRQANCEAEAQPVRHGSASNHPRSCGVSDDSPIRSTRLNNSALACSPRPRFETTLKSSEYFGRVDAGATCLKLAKGFGSTNRRDRHITGKRAAAG
ncbi:hypothetical protein IVA77_00120 [Bradyrhizobium sp. 136]|nr:hypothetical protein [Bradyrhizobium sp. 163]MCK1760037.1 hypothetical protein [Bradyrhizobium sp. 136]